MRRAAPGAVAAVLAALALVHHGLTCRGVIAAAFVAVLVVLADIDARTRLLPNRIVLPATAVILAAQVACSPDRTLEWILAALGAAAFLALPLLVSPGGLGMGDVKLGLLLGAGLGLAVIDGLLYGTVAGGLVAAWILARGGREARNTTIPYGPFLALGGIIAAFTGHRLGVG